MMEEDLDKSIEFDEVSKFNENGLYLIAMIVMLIFNISSQLPNTQIKHFQNKKKIQVDLKTPNISAMKIWHLSEHPVLWYMPVMFIHE